MSSLNIRLTKGRDGPSTIACTRPDGTSTWMRVQDFFPLHDLTHYAVESTLGLENAFYGLILSGWNITDFAAPGSASRTPPEAVHAEHYVAILQREFFSRDLKTLDEFNDEMSAFSNGMGSDPARSVTEEELTEMRAKVHELSNRWRSLAPGESMEVEFSPVSRHSV
jgi:hypothetical protein